MSKKHSSSNVFIDPYSDIGFKIIMAMTENSDLSQDFVNALFEGEVEFRNLVLTPVERAGTSKDYYKAINDAAGTSADNQEVIMEMQRIKQIFIKRRSIFYAAAALHKQLTKGDKDYPLNETYCISILNFNMDDYEDDDLENPIKTVKLFIQENGRVFYKPLIFKFVETKRFKKRENQLVTRFDKWLYCMNNMTILTEIPLILRGDPIFEKLFEVARISNLNKEQMNAYERAEMDRIDYFRGLEVSRQEGELKGRKEGELKGIQNGIIATARSMLKHGVSVPLVHKYTGLSLAQLKEFARNL